MAISNLEKWHICESSFSNLFVFSFLFHVVQTIKFIFSLHYDESTINKTPKNSLIKSGIVCLLVAQFFVHFFHLKFGSWTTNQLHHISEKKRRARERRHMLTFCYSTERSNCQDKIIGEAKQSKWAPLLFWKKKMKNISIIKNNYPLVALYILHTVIHHYFLMCVEVVVFSPLFFNYYYHYLHNG